MQGAMKCQHGHFIRPALGAKSNETSGVAIRARQNEGDTGTFVYVSNFGSAIQRTGQIIVNMIPQIYDTKRTIQIAGEDGRIDQLPINQPGFSEDGSGPGIGLNDVTVGAYQVAVEMGASYSTKREEARDGMTEMMRTLGPQGGLDLHGPVHQGAGLAIGRTRSPSAPSFCCRPRSRRRKPPNPASRRLHRRPRPRRRLSNRRAMAMELQKCRSSSSPISNLARKNELEDAKLQFEKAKSVRDPDASRDHKIAGPVRAEQVGMALLTLQLEATKVGHEMDKGTIQFENLGLKHAAIRGAEESDAALTERVQENINTAQANEIAKQNTILSSARSTLEHRKLTHGAMTDEQMAQERLAEQNKKLSSLRIRTNKPIGRPTPTRGNGAG